MSISNLLQPNGYSVYASTITADSINGATLSLTGDIGADNISSQGDIFFGADSAGNHVLTAGSSTDIVKTDYVQNFGAVGSLALNCETDGGQTGRALLLPYANAKPVHWRCDPSPAQSNWTNIDGSVITGNYDPGTGSISGNNASLINIADRQINMLVIGSTVGTVGANILEQVDINNPQNNPSQELRITDTAVTINGQPISKMQSDSFAPADDAVLSHELVAGSALMDPVENASHFIINYDTSGDLGVGAKEIVVDNTLTEGSSFTLFIIGKSLLAQAITFTPPATYTDTRDGSTGNASFDILANAVVGRSYKFTYSGNDVWYLESFETPTVMVLDVGAVATPSLSFLADANTGVWSSGADNVDFTTSGVNRLNVSNGGVSVASGVLSLQNGAVGAPSIHLGDNTSGLYRSALNEISVAVAGGQELRVGSEVEVVGVPLLTTIGVVGAPAIANNVDPTSGIYFGAAGLEVDSVVAGVEQLHIENNLVRVSPAGAVVEIPDGSNLLPSLYCAGSNTTGLYSSGADQLDLSVGTVQTLHVANNLVQVVPATAVVEIPDGTNLLPSLYCAGSATTGLYSSGADQLDLSVGTVQTLHVANDLVEIVPATAVLQVPAGVVGLPSVNFGDNTSGLYTSALDNIDVSCAGANVLNLSATGAVVTGSVTADDFILSTGDSIPFQLDFQFDINNTNASNIAVTNFQTLIDTGGAETRTLPNGTFAGQLKKITMYDIPGGTATITITTPSGGAGADTINLTLPGDSALCLWNGAGWRVIGVDGGVAGVTMPTVT